MGVVFSEETQTVTLSRHGAGIISKHKLATDGLLIMRFLGGSTETAIRLVGQLGQDARGFVYGVAFVDEEEDFWELKFPPPPRWSVIVDGPMQCALCKRCEIVDQSEVEADVYALSESILRYCIYCGTPTVWRRAPNGVVTSALVNVPAAQEVVMAGKAESSRSSVVAAARTQTQISRMAEPQRTALSGARPRLAGAELLVTEPLVEPALPPVASAVVAKAANRRRDVRTRVTFSACVRQGESEEIVECANLSKRGFGFRSRKEYAVGSEIEAAVPFYLGTPPTFVAGSVRHVTALPNHNFQYGVMYVGGAGRDVHELENGH
ncbi:MAG TPA: PilZ domain-containing protein [Candidatus Acidoferrum sp.]